MIAIEVHNAMSKIESHFLSYKQDSGFIILCFVNNTRILSFLHICCIRGSFDQMRRNAKTSRC